MNIKLPKIMKDDVQKKIKYLIFDFDGFIADTMESNIVTRLINGDAKDREQAIAAMNHYFENKPFHTRKEAISEVKLKQVTEWTVNFGKTVLSLGFDLFDDFIKEIKKIPNAKIAIVSTGSEVYVKKYSLSCGLEPTHVLTFEDHHSKEEKIEQICKDWGVRVQEVYYFTDSKADVYELENLLDRKKIIGCSWGYCGYQKLREILPEEQILREYSDIHRLL